jgi:transposase
LLQRARGDKDEEGGNIERNRTEGLWNLCYFSEENLSLEQAVNYYFERDLIEKSFRCLKSFLGLGPVYSWVEGRINLHLFICFLSYFFLNYLLYGLRRLKLA